MLRPRDLLSSSSVLLLSLPAFIKAEFDCDHIVADKQVFNLKSLDGPHNVHWIRDDTPPTLTNTTFTIDICKTLKQHDGPKGDDCPTGTRVCGIEYDYNLADGTNMINKVIPIAGTYPLSSGLTLEPTFTRMKHSASNSDSEKEGLRMELHGGKYPINQKSGISQKAVVEFICDPDRTGLGGDEPEKIEKRTANEEKYEDGDDKDRDKEKEEEDAKKDLKFVSYKMEKETMVLRLDWRTKYACEGTQDDGSGGQDSASSHWGFFTWFIIILFLGISAYLVFGSWLNYNRYGARGWDQLPHGDTIRDVPYLVKDFGRRVVNTVQGGGSRGGYSAV